MNIEKLNYKNILVTGGTGFVGSHLVENLVKQGLNVITTFQSIDPSSYFATQKLAEKVTMINADVANYEKIFNIITRFQIDCIFHLAAQSLVEVAYFNPKQTFYSNIIGTVNILESTRLFSKIKAVVIASSDKAYGKLGKKNKYTETDPLRGDHPYEVSKSAADLISYSYFKTYHIPVVVSRFGNIYGEGDLNFSRIIPGALKTIVNNEKMEIRSDGTYVRDYLYVKDVVTGYLLLASHIDRVTGEAFNFSSAETYSVLEIVNLIQKILKKKINYRISNTAKNEIPYQSLNSDKIKKVLNWKPKYTLLKTLPKIFHWYKKIL